jgi:hypothetical protein
MGGGEVEGVGGWGEVVGRGGRCKVPALDHQVSAGLTVTHRFVTYHKSKFMQADEGVKLQVSLIYCEHFCQTEAAYHQECIGASVSLDFCQKKECGSSS